MSFEALITTLNVPQKVHRQAFRKRTGVKHSRAPGISLVTLAIILLLFSLDHSAYAQGGSEGSGVFGTDVNTATEMLDLNSVELRTQLQSGLRVFLPEQQEFLDRVLVAVDNGQIPRAMVNMVYLWSQRRNRKVPFPYFEFAMRSLAERRGVIL